MVFGTSTPARKMTELVGRKIFSDTSLPDTLLPRYKVDTFLVYLSCDRHASITHDAGTVTVAAPYRHLRLLHLAFTPPHDHRLDKKTTPSQVAFYLRLYKAVCSAAIQDNLRRAARRQRLFGCVHGPICAPGVFREAALAGQTQEILRTTEGRR